LARTGANGTYTVVAINASGCTSLVSANFQVTSTLATTKPTLGVYPNPFQSTVSLTMENVADTKVVVNIFDVVGKLVHSQVVNVANGSVNEELNLAHLTAGSYQMHIATSAGVLKQRLMHNK